MLKLGETQELKIVKIVNFGAYLTEDGSEEVLLPIKEVPQESKVDDVLSVFLYKDSQDRLIATTKTPMVRLGEVVYLPVVNVTKIGAFIDWGLPKDLFLPYREQTEPVVAGKSYLVSLYIDKSDRLCATMKVYEKLSTNSPYATGDLVDGTVISKNEKFGIFVAVDDRYLAMIPKREDPGNLMTGDRIKARVTRVQDNGKLDLTVKEKSYLQMDIDAGNVLAEIEKRGGSLPFTDKADPELIKKEFHMSKSAFKRAIGRLLKTEKIEMTEESIVLK